jgi:hypothetical protein
MLNFTDLFANSMADLTFAQAVLTMLLSIVCGAVIAATYSLTTDKGSYSSNFFTTLIFLPAVVAVIIMLIGSNVARAFSLAGAFSIIRFRSAPGNPKDITYVLFSMAAGLACGMSTFVYALVFTVVLCLCMVVLCKAKIGQPKQNDYVLKITIPESLNFKGVFDTILNDYVASYTLSKIKTADMGSVFELTYHLSISESTDIKELIDKLRCKNGNLTITLTMATNDNEF